MTGEASLEKTYRTEMMDELQGLGSKNHYFPIIIHLIEGLFLKI